MTSGAGHLTPAMVAGMTDAQIAQAVADLPPPAVKALLRVLADTARPAAPPGPLQQAQAFDPGYRSRPHLDYLSARLAAAVADVEAGRSRYLTVSMPPRMGKSHLTSVWFPLWVLGKHPGWKVGMISHSPTLATLWGRQVRRGIEEHGHALGVQIARDAGAVSEWQTSAGGGVVSRSAPGQSVTGYGFKVLLVDDPTKDFAAAHSQNARDALWDWWVANAVTRLEPPSLVVIVGTRWHEDDLIGRVTSPQYEGDPAGWEQVVLPAIAGEGDVLGRAPGEPLLSPLIDETPEEALGRWAGLRGTVGSYVWDGLYQQEPSSPEGTIFDVGWWRYHTQDPAMATEDGRVVYLPVDTLARGEWLDSWDTSFKGGESSDYVVGQRWCRLGPLRVLVAQQRGRWGFTETLQRMRVWAGLDEVASPFGRYVTRRVVEDSANGPAILDVLRAEVPGLVGWRAAGSKEARARAVSPVVERGDVLLPLPVGAGGGWVGDLLGELREFPSGGHDDQVDALTQALLQWPDGGVGVVSVPRGVVPGVSPAGWVGSGVRRVAQTPRRVLR